jgi:hypothetical protein
MATRSTIALEYPDGTVKQVYCHWDGYPSHNGKLLLENWSDFEKLDNLMKEGDLSFLGESIGYKRSFSAPPFDTPEYEAHSKMCLFYGRDRGEEGCAARSFWNFEMYAMSGQKEEYNYVFRPNNGGWFYRTYRSKFFAELTWPAEQCVME